MKKFIINTGLYSLIILATAISLEVVLRHLPNDYVYKKNYLDTHANEIETLILGPSDTYLGINPVYFSDSAFNAAHVSQSLDYDYAILKQYDERLVNLKTVILPISYVSVCHQLIKSAEAWRVAKYTVYYGIIHENDPLKYHFAVLANTLKANILHIKSYLQGNVTSYSKQGWGTFYGYNQNLEESGKGWALGHTRDIHSPENQKILTDNISFLDSIITICQKHNAKLLLITPPLYKTYREHTNEEQLKTMLQTANEVANKHPNCIYLNLMADSTFLPGDFFDACHLSEIGAKKLSLKLANAIKAQNLYKSGDCGSSPQ